MISILATPYTFGFGLSFNIGLPYVNEATGQKASVWGVNLLFGPFYLQISYAMLPRR
jgi:hypothetical protein